MRLEVAVNLGEARDHHRQDFFARVGRDWFGRIAGSGSCSCANSMIGIKGPP
jgi:hypothetical protein